MEFNLGAMALHIGIDLDNTIVDYDGVFFRVAVEQGWVDSAVPKNHNDLRQHLLAEDGHDERWQWLQSQVYGPRIGESVPYEGMLAALLAWHEYGHRLTVVSHKSSHSNWNPGIELQQAAMGWLKRHGLINTPPATSIISAVYFEPDQVQKVARIAELACDVFIDDKLAVLSSETFPVNTIPGFFDPNKSNHDAHEAVRFHSWWQIRDWIEMLEQIGVMAYRRLVVEHGIPAMSYTSITAGSNNRVGRLLFADASTAISKQYCRVRNEQRDTARNEFDGLSFLAKVGVTRIPKPILFDEERRIGVYADVGVRRLVPHEINELIIDEAIDFIVTLKEAGGIVGSENLSEASEVRTRLAEYPAALQRRLTRLLTCHPMGSSRQLATLLHHHVRPMVEIVIARFECQIQALSIDIDKPITRRDMILSPSDFGFHNTILDEYGHLNYLDFEYFGWDDPAKLLADFVHHAGHEVPWPLCLRFVTGVCERLKHGDRILARWEWIVDLIGVEWLLIILNVADPSVVAQRRRADESLDLSTLIAARCAVAEKRVRFMEERVLREAKFLSVPMEQGLFDGSRLRAAAR